MSSLVGIGLKKKSLDTKILNSNIKVAFNNDWRIRTVDIKN